MRIHVCSRLLQMTVYIIMLWLLTNYTCVLLDHAKLLKIEDNTILKYKQMRKVILKNDIRSWNMCMCQLYNISIH